MKGGDAPPASGGIKNSTGIEGGRVGQVFPFFLFFSISTFFEDTKGLIVKYT